MTQVKKFSLKESFGLAFLGIFNVVKKERNMKIHLAIGGGAFLLGLFLGLNRFEWAMIVLVSSVVIAAEIFNAAIEQTCDYIDEQHDLEFGKTKVARDMAAGAVLVTAIASAIIGLLIFLPRILASF